MNIVELQNIAYGPHERNVLDAYLIGRPGEPSPTLVFFHGGGYVGGDKSAINSGKLKKECLEAGISVISCNYRFISSDPYPAPMLDGTRALQFVRYMAEEWNLDPNRIASAGSSAGGHIALWNALKGDSAKPDSADPVERMSSAVRAFIGFGTQVSKDQRFYDDIYDGPYIQPNIALYYSIESVEDLKRPEILKLAEEASAITYMSESAPPVFMAYDYVFDIPRIRSDAPVGEVIHHPVHGYKLKEKYDAIGKTFIFRHIENPIREGEMARFLQDSFKQAVSGK